MRTDHDSLAERGRALENDYFRRKDRELFEKMRLATAAERAGSEMGRRVGLDDPALLRELQALGFTAETVVLLPVVPLLEMAWAEGEVTSAERSLIVKFARRLGVDEASVGGRQLTLWMTDRPDETFFSGVRAVVGAVLSPRSGQADGRLTADELVARCEQIAVASGGFLGLRIGSVSSEELALLSRLVSSVMSWRH